MKNTITRSLLCGAALALAAAGSNALVADEVPKGLGDQPSESEPQQPQKKPQAQPQQKPQAQTQQKPQPQSQPQPKVQQKAKPKPKSTFGGYLSVVLPQSDLGNLVGTGIAAGGFWEMPFNGLSPNLSGVASLQYIAFGEQKFLGGITCSGTQVGVNYDLHYYFDKVYSGFYGLAGVGFHNCTLTIEVPALGIWGGAASGSETKFGFEVGAGYCFTKYLDAEAKYFVGSDSWSYVQASLKYRF